MTVSLPFHRQDSLLELLRNTLQLKRITRLHLQKLLGELGSMALTLPGSNGSFSFLQDALNASDSSILITTNMHKRLQDIAEDITSRPHP